MITHEMWAHAEPLLAPAMARGDRLPMSVVLAALERDEAHLWPGARSAAVCEPLKDYRIWLAGGDLAELKVMEAAASAWAKAQGFDRMSLRGRAGWARVLPDYVPETVLVKRL